MFASRWISSTPLSPMRHAPPVTALVISVLTATQIATQLLPSFMVVDAFTTFSLIPARLSFLFSPDAYMQALAHGVTTGLKGSDIMLLLGGGRSGFWTLLTYALLHGDWTHLTLNCATLAIFGSLLERRFGPRRFLAFLAVTAILGALAYYLFHPFDVRPVIGASASISAAMAASARFAFAPGALLGKQQASCVDMDPKAKTTLFDMFKNQRAIWFLGVWFGMTTLSQISPQAGSIHVAWEAHLGGFLAGLLLFDLFDRQWAFPQAYKLPRTAELLRG